MNEAQNAALREWSVTALGAMASAGVQPSQETHDPIGAVLQDTVAGLDQIGPVSEREALDAIHAAVFRMMSTLHSRADGQLLLPGITAPPQIDEALLSAGQRIGWTAADSLASDLTSAGAPDLRLPSLSDLAAFDPLLASDPALAAVSAGIAAAPGAVARQALEAPAPVTTSAASNLAVATTTPAENTGDVVLGAADEAFATSGSGANAVSAAGGNDTISTAGGNDVVDGDAGDDTLGGGAGDDVLIGAAGADTLTGGGGRDTFHFAADDLDSGAVTDTITDYQPGADRIELVGYSGVSSFSDLVWTTPGGVLTLGLRNGQSVAFEGFSDVSALSVGDFAFPGTVRDVVAGTFETQQLTETDDRFVSEGDLADDIEALGGHDAITSGAGDDHIDAGAGDDVIDAGAGNDTIVAGDGNDIITTGAGNDTVVFDGAASGDGVEFDLITDYVAGSTTIRLQDYAGLDNFADLTFRTLPSGLAVELGGDRFIALEGVASEAGLDPTDFEFPKTEVTNSGSELKVETTIVGGGDVGISSNEGGNLIGMDELRGDADFAGYDGSGQTVVVIDTGIDLDHAAFGPDADGDGVADRILYHEDFSSDRDGTANDVQGHGTHVASIVASSDARYQGIAPGASIIALQALGNDGRGSFTDIENAVQWVIDNGAAYNVVAVNMSLGGSDNVNGNQVNAFLGDEFSALGNAGIVPVLAAGNSYFDFQQPGMSSLAVDPNVIGVGAVWAEDAGSRETTGPKDFTTGPDRLTSFTQRTDDLDMIFAPGGGILGAAPGGGSQELSGTSMAAPMVAGMVAVAQDIATDLLGRRLTAAEFDRLLLDTADTINDGDDEDDNITNLDADLERANMYALAEAIRDLGDDDDGGDDDDDDDDDDDGPPVPRPGDDLAGDTGTTGELAAGGTATGDIETGADQDWFRMSLEAGATYRIEMRGRPTGDGTLSDPLMSLMDAGGRVVTSNDDGGTGLNSSLEYTSSTGGTFFLAAQSYGAATGTYTVELVLLSASVDDDWAGDQNTRSTVEVNGPAATGELEAFGDRDWHAVTLEAGGEYVIDLTGDGAAPLRDTYLRLYDGDGAQIALNDDGGEGLDSQLLFTAGSEGTYYVGAGAYADRYSGTYSVSVTGGLPGSGGDIPDDPSTEAQIEVGGTFDGTLETPGDRDWIAVSLLGGAVYSLTLDGFGDNALADPYLRVFDGAGNLVDFNDDGGDGLNSRLDSLSVNTTGTYFIGAGAYADYGSGDYRIGIERLSGAGDDIPADRSTTASIAPGDAVQSDLGFFGDRDWFGADLVAGTTYLISLEGSGQDALSDPYLRVYDGESRLVALDDDGGDGLDSELVFTANQTGNYYLSAGAYADFSTGDFTLTLADLGANDDYSADASTAGAIDVDGTATGEVEIASDRDWFAIDVQEGALYRFALDGESAGGGTLGDPTLHVRNAVGASLAYDDDSGGGLNSLIEYEARTTGTIYLDVGAYSSGTGTYRLTSEQISDGADDHGDDTSTGSSISVGGRASGAIEAFGDVDVFAVELERGDVYDFATVAGGVSIDPSVLRDTTLTLLGPDGRSLAYNDDGGPGLDSLIDDYEASASGTHYLQVRAYGDFSEGTYELTATLERRAEDGSDDYGQTPGNAVPLSIGESATGVLETPGDRDWLQVNLTQGDLFEFDLRGQATGAGTLSDPYLRLYDDGGSQVAFNDDGGEGLESRLLYTAQETGVFYLEAAAYADIFSGSWLLETELL